MSDAIYMFNALWFKGDEGRAMYRKYLKAAGEVIAELEIGANVLDRFEPQQALIGEFDADLMFVVEYPNQAAFDRFVGSPEYQAIAHLRENAIEKSLLIRCARGGF